MMFVQKPKYSVKPQLPEILDHEHLPAGAVELARINDRLNYQKDFVFVKNNEGLSIVRAETRLMPTGKEMYFIDQTDFPLGFLSWFPRALREFQKPPVKGGLPAGAMSSPDQDVEGEMLCIQRLMDAGNHQQGYRVLNRSRCRRGVTLEGHFDAQKIDFAENFLYEGGLLKLIEDLGQRYEQGAIR